MSTNILGNPEALRKLWCGLLADLMVKLTGEDGPEYQEELAKYLRKEPCWIKDTIVLQKALKVLDVKFSDSLPLPVNYDLTLQQMIEAGKYDRVNPDITANHFPVKGGMQERKTEFVHFNRNISSDDALTELAKQGLRPGAIEELLAVGATCPDKQREFPIVALGSSCLVCDRCSVACLGEGDAGRYLSLAWRHGDWNSRYRFLAFRI